MRARQFILREYSRDVTAQKLGPTLLQKFRKEPQQWQQRVVGDQFTDDATVLQYLLQWVEKSDPTKNKQYVPWIIRTYTNTPHMKFEDAVSKVTEPLNKFYKLVQKKQIPAPNNDIGRIKDLASLVQTVDQYPDVVDADKDTNRGVAKEVYRDQDLRVIMPEDTEAACYYGQGTKWCTAGKNNNMFATYNKQGPMYIILPSKPAHAGEKYQLHFETKQFMDEHDRRINLANLVQRYPQLQQVFQEPAKKYNIWSLLLDPAEYQERIGGFVTNFTRGMEINLGENHQEYASQILSAVYDEYQEINQFIADLSVFENDISLALTDHGQELINDIIRAAGDDVSVFTNEDQIHDVIADAVGNWLHNQGFYEELMDELDNNGEDDLTMEVGIALEGEFTILLLNIVNSVTADII